MIRILAPAKINLGLEIHGKRKDGYHEIRTILCAISIFDVLEFVESTGGGFRIDDPALRDKNLVETAVSLAKVAFPDCRLPDIHLRKQIPVAAGLGGASSDAAATLLALHHLNPGVLHDCTLHEMASRLGSDVPFFLQAGLAMASGRGESLQRLPYQRIDVAVVSPAISIPAKTATMYAALVPADFSDGTIVDSLRTSLARSCPLDAEESLPNAFAKSLYAMHPSMSSLADRIGRLSKMPVHLSGAGPTHYVVCKDTEHRLWLRNRLRSHLPSGSVQVLAARSVSSTLLQEN